MSDFATEVHELEEISIAKEITLDHPNPPHEANTNVSVVEESLTEEQEERAKFERAKKVRREQLDVLFNMEVSLGTTIASLQKSLNHYELEKLALHEKRTKYRVVLAKFKGKVDQDKMDEINKILHQELPQLIDDIDEKLINGQMQLQRLQRKLRSITKLRKQTEKEYERMFDVGPGGDLEGGGAAGSAAPDSDEEETEALRKITIEQVMWKFDPEYFPPPDSELAKMPRKAKVEEEEDDETSSESEVGDLTSLLTKKSENIKKSASSYHPPPFESPTYNPFSSSASNTTEEDGMEMVPQKQASSSNSKSS